MNDQIINFDRGTLFNIYPESRCPVCGGRRLNKSFQGPTSLGGSVSSRKPDELLRCSCEMISGVEEATTE